MAEVEDVHRLVTCDGDGVIVVHEPGMQKAGTTGG